MRILQLISSLGYFGAENVLIELSESISKSSYKPIIGCLISKSNPHVEIINEAKKRGLPVTTFKCDGKIDLKTLHSIRKYIKNNKISIIHSHNYKSNTYALLSSFGLNISLISTCHNWLGSSIKMKYYASLDKYILKYFDKVVAVSNLIKEEILLNKSINSNNVICISNGINVNRFTSDVARNHIRDKLGIQRDLKVVGTVGRLSEEKGHIYLLRAAEKIIKFYPKIVFVIVGDGPLMRSLKFKAKNLPVIFTGYRDDIPALYSAMDIFVLPSLNEGLPMALLEAMASNVPVVASNVGHIPEVIRDNGLLVEAGNKDQIADAILCLINNGKLCKENIISSLQVVIDSYSSANMAKEYIAVYNAIAPKKEY